MRAQDLTTAKTVAKISVVSNTAGGRRAWHADPQVLTIPHPGITPSTETNVMVVNAIGRVPFALVGH
jgi:hypothetical protein